MDFGGNPDSIGTANEMSAALEAGPALALLQQR